MVLTAAAVRWPPAVVLALGAAPVPRWGFAAVVTAQLATVSRSGALLVTAANAGQSRPPAAFRASRVVQPVGAAVQALAQAPRAGAVLVPAREDTDLWAGAERGIAEDRAGLRHVPCDRRHFIESGSLKSSDSHCSR